MFVLLLVFAIAFTPFLATCGEADDAVTAILHRCPRALELLGEDAKPSHYGWACGSTENEGAYGTSSWHLPYSGSHGRGTVSYAAQKRAGVWHVDAATLEIDDETVDLVACAGGAPSGPASSTKVLAQTNADGATATFDGKVLRSTHSTIHEGATCRGTLKRERGSAFAQMKVECDPGTSESGGAIQIYDGTGTFTLDVRDPSRRDDDRSEYDDSKTSEADHTPGCRLSQSGASGTLTIWDDEPAYEIVVPL